MAAALHHGLLAPVDFRYLFGVAQTVCAMSTMETMMTNATEPKTNQPQPVLRRVRRLVPLFRTPEPMPLFHAFRA